MAPILGLLAYLLTDRVIEAQPVDNSVFQLSASKSCLPMANQCVLKRGSLEANLIGKVRNFQTQLAMLVNDPVTNVSFALSEDESNFKQYRMMKSEDGKYWQLSLAEGEDITNMKFFRVAFENKTNSYYLQHSIDFYGN